MTDDSYPQGMLAFFQGGAGATEADVIAAITSLVNDGLITLHEDENGEVVFRMTDAGRDHVENTIFPKIGVTTEEAMAWLDERLGQ